MIEYVMILRVKLHHAYVINLECWTGHISRIGVEWGHWVSSIEV